MQNFPINANARIRLAWGRSATDKHLEQVKKLSVALGMPFDNVLKMVESQDRGTVKNITSAVAQHLPSPTSPTEGTPKASPSSRAYDSEPFSDMQALNMRPSLERLPHRSTMPSLKARPSFEHIGHRHSCDNTVMPVSPVGAYSHPGASDMALAALSRGGPSRQGVSASQAGFGSSVQPVPPQRAMPVHQAAAAAASPPPPNTSFAELFGGLNLASEPVSYA